MELKSKILDIVGPVTAARYFKVPETSRLYQDYMNAANELLALLAPFKSSRTIDTLTDAECEEISRIFYPNDKMVLSFSCSWERTRANVGRHIVSDDFPVAFSQKKYFELFEYLKSKGITVS